MSALQARPEVSDLSLLSLLAAHELERIGRHEASDGQYLSALRDYLTHQVGPARADIKHIAPSTIQLYRRAVRDATSIDPPDFTTFVAALDSLLNQLKIASEAATKRAPGAQSLDIKSLLAFIVSLHGQLLAQKQRISSARNSTKYRV